jgi:ATP-dependent RNA helicase DDX27
LQTKSIPVILQGKDLFATAETGSGTDGLNCIELGAIHQFYNFPSTGKTAAFAVPILQRLLFKPKSENVTRVLVLLPSRELAVQCHE